MSQFILIDVTVQFIITALSSISKQPFKSFTHAHAHLDSWPLIGSCTCQRNVGGVSGSYSAQRAEATELSNTNSRLKYYPGGTKTSFFALLWKQEGQKQTSSPL